MRSWILAECALSAIVLMAAASCGGSSGDGGSSDAGGANQGGASGAGQGGTGGSASGGSGAGQQAGSAGAEVGGSGGGATICPYTVASMTCPASCDNLKTIAAKCKDDPNLSDYTKMALAAAAVGTGTGCKTTCAVDSASYPKLWACFQAVPVEADCTAIAGCTMGNCL